MKFFLYLISTLFAWGWAIFLIDIFQSELYFTLNTKLFCIVVGILINISFVLSTLNLKKGLRYTVAILLVPTIILNFGFVRTIGNNLVLAIIWGVGIAFISYYQLLKNKGESNEKSY